MIGKRSSSLAYNQILIRVLYYSSIPYKRHPFIPVLLNGYSYIIIYIKTYAYKPVISFGTKSTNASQTSTGTIKLVLFYLALYFVEINEIGTTI